MAPKAKTLASVEARIGERVDQISAKIDQAISGFNNVGVSGVMSGSNGYVLIACLVLGCGCIYAAWRIMAQVVAVAVVRHLQRGVENTRALDHQRPTVATKVPDGRS